MRMFVQNVVIDDGEDEEAALPLPVDHISANMGDEEDALLAPTLHFSVNRRKPTGKNPGSHNRGGTNPDNGDALNFTNLTGESTIRGPRVDSSIAQAGAECPECGFRFTSEDNMPEPVYRDYPKTRHGTQDAEITCPRCGETIE